MWRGAKRDGEGRGRVRNYAGDRLLQTNGIDGFRTRVVSPLHGFKVSPQVEHVMQLFRLVLPGLLRVLLLFDPGILHTSRALLYPLQNESETGQERKAPG